MSTLTLPEFLLAQCDADEKVAIDAYNKVTSEKFVPHKPRHVLAQVAALRSMVRLLESSGCNSQVRDLGLKILAHPFADRPGWSEEWRL